MKDDMPFVDSNILVYAFDRSEALKHKKAKKVIEKCFKGENGLATSVQALSEFFVNATKKIEMPISQEEAKDIIEKIIEFRAFSVFDIKASTVQSAVSTSQKTGVHYWDALIAETMKENGVFEILTENTKDFERVNEIKAINPLK